MTLTNLAPDEELLLNYPTSTQSLTWNYTTDRARWIANGQINTPPTGGTGIGGLGGLFGTLPLGPLPAGLSGALAIRGNTTLGSTARPQNGIHVSTVAPSGGSWRAITRISRPRFVPRASGTAAPMIRCGGSSAPRAA